MPLFVPVTGAAVCLASAGAALAHHGFGRFDRSKPVEYTGTITSIDFVNPHSYLNFDITDASGAPVAMPCEVRAATLMRRSGWSEEMFAKGATVKIEGFGHERRKDDWGVTIWQSRMVDSWRFEKTWPSSGPFLRSDLRVWPTRSLH